MKAFTYDFTVVAASEKEAYAKMEALKLLASRFTTRTLCQVADVVENDPVKTQMALQLLG